MIRRASAPNAIMMMQAAATRFREYRCCVEKCSHTWKAPNNHRPCPKCGSIYFEWLNFSEFEL